MLSARCGDFALSPGLVREPVEVQVVLHRFHTRHRRGRDVQGAALILAVHHAPQMNHAFGHDDIDVTQFGPRLSPQKVARMCLDTNDRGGLYCMPQPDARIGWGIKRFTPTVYTRAVGLTTRITAP